MKEKERIAAQMKEWRKKLGREKQNKKNDERKKRK